jgi:hypothetical protein
MHEFIDDGDIIQKTGPVPIEEWKREKTLSFQLLECLFLF